MLEWVKVLNREIHTDETIAQLRQLRIALQEIILANLPDARPGQKWAFLKFFNLRKFEEAIKAVASAAYTDTGYQERSHKELKPSAAFTNNRLAQMPGQLVQHSNRAAAGKRLLECAEFVEDKDKAERKSVVSALNTWT